jgi:hypothetical protein
MPSDFSHRIQELKYAGIWVRACGDMIAMVWHYKQDVYLLTFKTHQQKVTSVRRVEMHLSQPLCRSTISMLGMLTKVTEWLIAALSANSLGGGQKELLFTCWPHSSEEPYSS